MRFQLKVEYGPGKFVKFWKNISLKTYHFRDLVADVIKNCPTLAHLTPSTIRIRYADEDGDYINLREGDTQNFDEMLSHSQHFEERDYKKIILRVNELDSPLCQQEKKRKRTHCDKNSEFEPRSLTYSVGEQNRNVDLEMSSAFESDIDEETSSMEETCSSTNPIDAKRCLIVGKSPLEKYLEKAERNLETQSAKLEMQQIERDEINDKLHAANLAAGDRKNSVCGNCHLRLGHTQKTCTLERCTDVFFCGQEKRHTGQINKRRLDQEITRQKKLVSECAEEVNKRKAAIQTVEKSKTKQIESLLLDDDNKHVYICNGRNLNWNLVRKHATVIENYCKKYQHGRIPSKHEIPSILSTALEDYNATCGKALTAQKRCKSKGNPKKETLEQYGINFPTCTKSSAQSPLLTACSGSCSYRSQSCTDNAVNINERSDIFRTLPMNEEEEQNQLELAMNASLHIVQPSKQSGIESSWSSETVVCDKTSETVVCDKTSETVVCDKTCSQIPDPVLTEESAAIALLSLNSKGYQ